MAHGYGGRGTPEDGGRHWAWNESTKESFDFAVSITVINLKNKVFACDMIEYKKSVTDALLQK